MEMLKDRDIGIYWGRIENTESMTAKETLQRMGDSSCNTVKKVMKANEPNKQI